MANAEILIEDLNSEYELNEEDVLEYAKQIGIDVQNEKHLIWIAEEGLSANVPDPWLILSDGKGRIFYSNIETGEKSWYHPLDAEYSALVARERRKNENSPLSCGYESKNPLSSIHDGSQSQGRFPKAPLPQLSSLSDAPPLSLSGKNTPPPLKNTPIQSEKKRDLGHFENRRGTKLAPVKLGSLKMPVPSPATQKPSSTMSFMPKGAALSRNIRRPNDEPDVMAKSQFSARPQIGLSQDDLNESLNSDDGSKYSYEETEDDMERSYDEMNPSDVGSQFSPPHSAIGSPEALDINSLVQLGTKLQPRLESSKKTHHLQSLKEEEPPSLNLRKTGQPSFLKPLQQQPAKKTLPKAGKKKNTSLLSSKYEQYAVEEDVDSKIAALNEEQRLRFESIQREWATMQEELVRDEKVKYDKMVIESNKRLEEDELLIKKENKEKLSKMKGELEKKIKEEESSIQVTLNDMKKTNEQKYADEEKEFNNSLKALTQTMQAEIEKMEMENTEKIKKKKEQLDADLKSEVEKLTSSQKDSIKNIEESHATEIAKLEQVHRKKMEEIQNVFKNEEDEAKVLAKEKNPPKSDSSNIEIQKMDELLAKQQAKHEELLSELKDLQAKIASEKEALAKLEEKTVTAQTSFEEVQEEVDKTENDLDLLRTEKSALISELNILKDNIKNEKSNLVKEKNMGSTPHKKPDTLHKGVNTSSSQSVVCQAVQTYVEMRDISCQIEEIVVSTKEKHSQTDDQKSRTFDISCQADLVQQATTNKSRNVTTYDDYSVGAYVKDKDVAKICVVNSMDSEHVNVDMLVNKVLENAMLGISDKMEARLKIIEEKLGSLDKNINSPSKISQSPDTHNNIFTTETKSHSQAINQNKDNHFSSKPHPNETSYMKEVLSSRNKCSCERGDVDSCDVMKDVKSSIYRLNDILSTSFVPSLGNTVISGFNFPASNYSSPLQSFYSQFRQLQEKHRVTELRHKMQSQSWKESPNALNASAGYMRDFIGTESLQFNRALNSSPYSGVIDDPVNRARNLVLREQARSWKQQQQILSASDQQGFIPLERSRNLSISDISPSRTSSGLSEQSPPLQYPFLKFEPDPESEYNEWMSRLKILQDKIRSHRLL